MFRMIRTVFINLLHGPATRLTPRAPFSRARGHLEIRVDSCVFCGLCQNRCPADAIKVDRGMKAWTLDPFRCIVCGECISACPRKCLFLESSWRPSATDKANEVNVQQESAQVSA